MDVACIVVFKGYIISVGRDSGAGGGGRGWYRVERGHFIPKPFVKRIEVMVIQSMGHTFCSPKTFHWVGCEGFYGTAWHEIHREVGRT